MMPIRLLAAALSLAWCASALAAGVPAGPKGGRILNPTAPHAEFLVRDDRRVVVTFYDRDLATLPPGPRHVAAIVEAPDGRVRLEFEPDGDTLVSNSDLPEGDGYQVVVQVRAQPDARPSNYRVRLLTETCGDCDRAEYACTCEGHAGGGGHGHGH